MTGIDDERIRFYLQHEERIQEWADIRNEACSYADSFYLSLIDDLEQALKNGAFGDSHVETFKRNSNEAYPQVGLRRTSWPTDDPNWNFRVALEWQGGENDVL